MRKKLDQVGKAALGVLGSVTLQSILGAAGLQITRRRRNISPTVLAFGAGVAVAAGAAVWLSTPRGKALIHELRDRAIALVARIPPIEDDDSEVDESAGTPAQSVAGSSPKDDHRQAGPPSLAPKVPHNGETKGH